MPAKIDLTCLGLDILNADELRELDKRIQQSKEKGCEYFALGIFSDELYEKMSHAKPLKPVEERIKIASFLRGIDFVFEVKELNNREHMIKQLKEQYIKRKEEETTKKNNSSKPVKKYKVAYAPGTWDLFHAGHLENLSLAAKQTEKLIVGVKSDELVMQHKKHYPEINEEDRMEILRHFKFVDDTYLYYTRNLHTARDWIESKFGSFDAVFLGSDLKQDFKDVNDINIVFTDRDEKQMATRSSSGYRKKLKNRPRTIEGSLIRLTRIKSNETISIDELEAKEDDER